MFYRTGGITAENEMSLKHLLLQFFSQYKFT